MKNLFLFTLISFFGLTLVATDVDARRLGGGKSFGRSAPQQMQQNRQSNQQSANAQRQNTQTGAPNRSGASRWLGPLAGLAAGGLLAALFFGDAFEGFQFMDFLLIAALVFGGIMLFRMMRAKSSAPNMSRQAYAPAGPTPNNNNFETPEIGSGLSSGGSSAGAVDYRPSWFNEDEFLQGAKTHFIRLQAAWDTADMKDIREYTTPDLFAQLTLERQSYQGERQFTEVVELDAELLSLVQEDDQIVASVRYSGLIRENKDGDAKSFSEVWHVQRSLNESDANWYVAGIEQENKPS